VLAGRRHCELPRLPLPLDPLQLRLHRPEVPLLDQRGPEVAAYPSEYIRCFIEPIRRPRSPSRRTLASTSRQVWLFPIILDSAAPRGGCLSLDEEELRYFRVNL
jgi:hypothetical protein